MLAEMCETGEKGSDRKRRDNRHTTADFGATSTVHNSPVG